MGPRLLCLYVRCSFDAVRNSGNIVHLNLLGKHVVVLNSYDIAKDVLEQSRYNNRPHFTMAGELYVPSRSMFLAKLKYKHTC